MAEMLIQSESLTSIADKIRVLSGTEEAMRLDDMENHVEDANINIDAEANLISQIAAALEGKAGGGGGGGSGGVNVETCTVTIEIPDEPRTVPFYCILTVIENGKISYVVVNKSSEFSNAIKNNPIHYMSPEDGHVFTTCHNGVLETNDKFIHMFSESGMGIILRSFTAINSDRITIEVY